MEKLGLKIVVVEQSGIRRFLYPLRIRIPQVYARSAGRLALSDENDVLIPSHVASVPGGVECLFAMSLAPFESRRLRLVRMSAEHQAPIPDPLNVSQRGSMFVSKQSRVKTTIGPLALPTSVIYSGVEHLSGPPSITLDGVQMEPTLKVALRCERPSTGLSASFAADGVYSLPGGKECAARTDTELTCCKSWTWLRHAVADAPEGSVLRYTVPLTVGSDVQTCDFGIGNGAYAKIQAGSVDAVVWEIDRSQDRANRYRIRVQLPSGELRTDYTGEIRGLDRLAALLWLHWVEPSKSLALAITDVATGCDRITIRLGADGVVTTDFLIGSVAANPARFGICYHFLDNVPAVAAATNPASLIAPPKVSVAKGSAWE